MEAILDNKALNFIRWHITLSSLQLKAIFVYHDVNIYVVMNMKLSNIIVLVDASHQFTIMLVWILMATST